MWRFFRKAWFRFRHERYKGRPGGRVRVVPPGADRPLTFFAESSTELFRTENLGDEREALEHFLQELEPQDVVWDIGSNIGVYALSSAQRSAAIRVFAFEPDPRIANRLGENAVANGITNVHVYPLAVGRTSGTMTLFTDGVHGFSPSLTRKTDANAPQGQIEVRVESADRLIESEGVPGPDVVKVDVEGAEQDVLVGMHGRLTGPSPPRLLFVELHPKFLAASGGSVEHCRRLLTDAGYTEQLARHRPNPLVQQDEILTVWKRDASSSDPSTPG